MVAPLEKSEINIGNINLPLYCCKLPKCISVLSVRVQHTTTQTSSSPVRTKHTSFSPNRENVSVDSLKCQKHNYGFMSLFEYHTKVSCSIIIPSVAWMSQNLKGYTNKKKKKALLSVQSHINTEAWPRYTLSEEPNEREATCRLTPRYLNFIQLYSHTAL